MASSVQAQVPQTHAASNCKAALEEELSNHFENRINRCQRSSNHKHQDWIRNDDWDREDVAELKQEHGQQLKQDEIWV
jgi:hypothetical protein